MDVEEGVDEPDPNRKTSHQVIEEIEEAQVRDGPDCIIFCLCHPLENSPNKSKSFYLIY